MTDSNDLAIAVAGLRKEFVVGLRGRKRVALDGMNLEVRRGQIYGFLGPNGAGKTTSIKVLTSLLRPDAGTALLFGRPPSDPEARRRIGFLPESPVFYEHLTGREYLAFCGALSGMDRKRTRTRAGELLELVGLTQAADLLIRRYSKGMTQRLGLAQALIHDPDLVILDEPMSGLDPMGRADVRDVMLALQKQGKTVFFSTHIIPDVEAICNEVGIVNKGKLIRVGTVQEIMAEGATGATEIVAERLPDAFSFPGAEAMSSAGGRKLLVASNAEVLRGILAEVLRANGSVVSVNPRRASLEDLVIRMLDRTES
jgi:ABC-2 type transport system ATP-binding protein